MKTIAKLLLAVALTTVIVLPVAAQINNSRSNRALSADGIPTPPVPPHAA